MTPGTIIYLSHSANRREDPDWWIVEPREGAPERLLYIVRNLVKRRRVLQVVIHADGVEARELYPETVEVMTRYLEYHS